MKILFFFCLIKVELGSLTLTAPGERRRSEGNVLEYYFGTRWVYERAPNRHSENLPAMRKNKEENKNK